MGGDRNINNQRKRKLKYMAAPPTLQKPRRTWLYVLFLIVAICVVAGSIVAWPKKPTQNENQGTPTAPQLSEDFTGENLTSLEAQGWRTWYKTQMPEVLDNNQASFSPIEVSLENGALKATGAGGFIYPANWGNYALTFKFRIEYVGNSWGGLAFRSDNAWTSENWPQNSYILQLGYMESSGKLWKIVNGVWTSIASEGVSITRHIWYDVRLEAQGSSLKVYLDNQILISATDGSLTSGSIGLLNRDTVYFDDITMSPLTA